ncbi:putative mediator of RNA polymerase II transcription subunit 26 isoform X3 [Lytechinus pictus]|uniref:putative mediator of RNA polymerase II transcription subunit 26 isoform X3 n=1 Tax=Lytechinus pictus TaxID=7653 RepID=UPI0030BA0DB0
MDATLLLSQLTSLHCLTQETLETLTHQFKLFGITEEGLTKGLDLVETAANAIKNLQSLFIVTTTIRPESYHGGLEFEDQTRKSTATGLVALEYTDVIDEESKVMVKTELPEQQEDATLPVEHGELFNHLDNEEGIDEGMLIGNAMLQLLQYVPHNEVHEESMPWETEEGNQSVTSNTQNKSKRFRNTRDCPICSEKVGDMSKHLERKHKLDRQERKKYLLAARAKVPIQRQSSIMSGKMRRRRRSDCPICEGKNYTSLSNHLLTVHGMGKEEIRKTIKVTMKAQKLSRMKEVSQAKKSSQAKKDNHAKKCTCSQAEKDIQMKEDSRATEFSQAEKNNQGEKLQVKEVSQVKKDGQAMEDSQVQRDGQAKKDSQSLEDSQVETDSQAKEDSQAMEDSQVERGSQAKKDSQAMEDSQVETDSQAKEDSQAMEDSQVERDSQAKKDSQSKEDSQAVEDSHTMEDSQFERDSQAKRDSQAMEDNPVERDSHAKNDSQTMEDSQVERDNETIGDGKEEGREEEIGETHQEKADEVEEQQKEEIAEQEIDDENLGVTSDTKKERSARHKTGRKGFRNTRDCPICSEKVEDMSKHLARKHKLDGKQRKKYLLAARARVPIQRRSSIQSGKRVRARSDCPLCEGKNYSSLDNHLSTVHAKSKEEIRRIKRDLKEKKGQCAELLELQVWGE